MQLQKEENNARKELTQRERILRDFENADPRRARRMINDPEYKKDERLGCLREVNAPPNQLFEPLGWDRNPSENPPYEKHYRKFIT